MRHLLSIKDLSRKEIEQLIRLAVRIKKAPKKYYRALEHQTLLMLFETVSVRTRLSFEAAMLQLGGHAFYYDLHESTLGKKETMHDFAQTVSRYCDAIMGRVFSHELLTELARHAGVPVINGMTTLEHPCQILSDLLTIYEKKKTLAVNVAYLGDANNNVTHSLMYAAAATGMKLRIACPGRREFMPLTAVMRDTKKAVSITLNPREAAAGADIIYTDSWMSYHVPEKEKQRRVRALRPYQVNRSLMKHAPKALFMHCLPAGRGSEVTSDVIDSVHSAVFDQAENRLHMQKAILLWLMKR